MLLCTLINHFIDIKDIERDINIEIYKQNLKNAGLIKYKNYESDDNLTGILGIIQYNKGRVGFLKLSIYNDIMANRKLYVYENSTDYIKKHNESLFRLRKRVVSGDYHYYFDLIYLTPIEFISIPLSSLGLVCIVL